MQAAAFSDERPSPVRVLLVEDDEAQRQTLTDILSDEGFEPAACGTVDEALSLVDQHDFAVAVVDQRLPGATGLDFLERLRADDNRLRVIINTGFGSFNSAKRSVNLGAFAYVEKAGDPAELLLHVSRAVRERMGESLKNTEQRLRAIFDHAPLAMALKDVAGRFIIFGLREEDVRGRSAEDILPRELAEATRSHEREVIESDRAIEREYVLSGGSGEQTTLLVVNFPIHDASSRVASIGTITSDITEQKRAQEALALSEERYQGLYDNAPDMYFTVSEDGAVLSVNQFGADYLGHGKGDLIGAPFWRVVYPDDVPRVREQMRQMFEGARPEFEMEFRQLREGGSVLWVHGRARLQQDSPEARPELRIVCRDITEAHDLSEELSYQASHDALTGLVNRRELENRLARVLETARSVESEHALCYLDLDQFKIINDTCGHAAGDELLRRLADLLSTRVRKRDTLARLGGDEFGVLMEHCTLMQARRVSNALRLAVEGFRFSWSDKTFTIGVSIGLVPITGAWDDVNSVLGAADTACYVAKDKGRNRIHVYHEDDFELSRRHGEMEWVSRINHALAEDRFCLYYQVIEPIAATEEPRAADGGGQHYELLLRMQDEDGHRVPPGAFLPAAERYGLAARLDRWVIEHAFDWLAQRPEHVGDLYLCSINLSGSTLSEETFLDFVLSKLRSTGLPAQKLCFELTETAAIANLGAATRFMGALKERGCRFALDDFGSGFSSFAHLKFLPVDFLKIDGVFVKGIVHDTIDLAMVRSINEISRVMGKRTIAEFVESEAILAKLADIGVDYAEGYHIGPPRPLLELGSAPEPEPQ